MVKSRQFNLVDAGARWEMRVPRDQAGNVGLARVLALWMLPGRSGCCRIEWGEGENLGWKHAYTLTQIGVRKTKLRYITVMYESYSRSTE